MPFLSELLGKRVLDSRAEMVGHLADVIVPGDAAFPAVSAIVVRRRRDGVTAVPWCQVQTFEPGRIALAIPKANVEEYQRAKYDLELVRDVLDKQIVDTDGAKVVRVNDLRLARTNGEYRLVAVDNSLRGLVRRMGLKRLAASLPGGERAHYINWDDVDLIPTDATMVKLKVPHQHLARLHPSDIADIVEQLSANEGRVAIESLDVETAADALAEVEPEHKAAILERIEHERAADILEEMAPDEAADVLGDMSGESASRLLRLMEPKAAQDVRELLAYPEDSAGGLMTTDDVLQLLRRLAPDAEGIYYLYVVDDEEHLQGVVSLRDLVVSPPEHAVSGYMLKEVVRVHVDAGLDEITKTLDHYNLLAVPVVDSENRIQGVITIDDIMQAVMPRTWRRRLSRMLG